MIRQINTFFSLILILGVVLFLMTITGIIMSDPSLPLLTGSHLNWADFFQMILYKAIYHHPDFFVASLGLTILIYYGFSPLSNFKSKFYRLFILLIPLIIICSLFYFENFYFPRYRPQFSNKARNLELKIKKNIDQRKFFPNLLEKTSFKEGSINLYVSDSQKIRARGFIIHNGYIINDGIFYYDLQDYSLKVQTPERSFTIKPPEQNKIPDYLQYDLSKINVFAFLLFILIPLALLFNNQNWYLRTLIFLTFSMPLYWIAFENLNKLVFSLKLDFIKIPVKWIEVKDLAASLIYFILGNILFIVTDTVRKIKVRIDIGKAKRIRR